MFDHMVHKTSHYNIVSLKVDTYPKIHVYMLSEIKNIEFNCITVLLWIPLPEKAKTLL